MILRLLRIMCSRKEQSLLFDLFKAFDQIESSHKSNSLIWKDLYLPPCVRWDFLFNIKIIPNIMDTPRTLSSSLPWMRASRVIASPASAQSEWLRSFAQCLLCCLTLCPRVCCDGHKKLSHFLPHYDQHLQTPKWMIKELHTMSFVLSVRMSACLLWRKS